MKLHGLKNTCLLFCGISIIIVLVRICLLYNYDYETTLPYNPEAVTILEQDGDSHCIKTVEYFRNVNGNFIIPEDEILSPLPNHVVDCLYQRSTTTLQLFCSQIIRHGKVNGGWNVCEDKCYKPASDTHIISISNYDHHINSLSIRSRYNIPVHSFNLSLTNNKDRTVLLTPDSKQKERIPFTLASLSQKVYSALGRRHILFIHADNLTGHVLEHLVNSGLLDNIQQLSIRMYYGNGTPVDYLQALRHLRQLLKLNFRIYWSRIERSCILQNNTQRTMCYDIDMVYNKCMSPESTIPQTAFLIPKDQVLKRMKEEHVRSLYMRYLTSTQIYCKENVRLGNLADGGWNICIDHLYRPIQPCLVYSFGINWDFSFDDDVARTYGCTVHAFDPSMKTKDFRRNHKVWFYGVGLADRTSHFDEQIQFSTLNNIIVRLHHQKRVISVLKIDIESWEWKALPDMISSGSLKRVLQLLMEFHGKPIINNLNILRQLYEAGFRIFWFQINPYPGNLYYDGFVQHSTCYEVCFVNINL